MVKLSNVVSAVALAALPGAEAYWRMSCSLIQTSRLDPIVYPGTVSAHVHKVSGASNFGPTTSYDQLLASRCTSCEIQDDKSAYWTPQLYYEFANKTLTEVPNGGTVVYYLGRGENRTNIETFPPGFKMLSGDPYLRSYTKDAVTYSDGNFRSRPIADRVSFACLDSSGTLPEQPYMFRTDCDNGMRAQIQFPSCWDGRDYQADQSHVAYMSDIDNGICPPTHPRQLAHLFFEVIYGVNDVAKEDGGRFVFANGDPTGYGFHGDFVNGWEEDTLTEALATCVNDDSFGGQVEYCAALKKSYNPYYATNCPERPAIVAEQYTGMLECLPGCNVITEGPERATQLVCPNDNPAINFTPDTGATAMLTPSIGDTLAGTSSVFVGCAADTGNPRALSGHSFSAKNMTNDICVSLCKSAGYPFAGVEYSKECWCGDSLSATAGDCTEPQMICAGDDTQWCGAPSLLAVWKDTQTQPSGDKLTAANGTATYFGCYTDTDAGNRALSRDSYYSDSMTVDSCAAYCQGKNYALFGVQYGQECYCSDTLKATSALAADRDCNMKCKGDTSETCGGSSRLSVYNSTTYIATHSVSSVSGGDGSTYLYKGCYSEGTGGRALSTASTSDSAMTVEMCATYCGGKGLKYMGVEWGRECYCNNEGPRNGAVSASEEDCNMNCAGNMTEFCGGTSRVSVYEVGSA